MIDGCSPTQPALGLQCNEEIGRLEAEQAKAMRGMIQVKTAEMARLCETTVLPMPNLSVLVDNVESPGQVAEVLSKLVRMLAQFTVLVEQREPIMRTIIEVEEGFKEAAWHHQHQQDNLFNNRVSSRYVNCLISMCMYVFKVMYTCRAVMQTGYCSV